MIILHTHSTRKRVTNTRPFMNLMDLHVAHSMSWYPSCWAHKVTFSFRYNVILFHRYSVQTLLIQTLLTNWYKYNDNPSGYWPKNRFGLTPWKSLQLQLVWMANWYLNLIQKCFQDKHWRWKTSKRLTLTRVTGIAAIPKYWEQEIDLPILNINITQFKNVTNSFNCRSKNRALIIIGDKSEAKKLTVLGHTLPLSSFS